MGKIKVKASASDTSKTVYFSFADLGITDGEWQMMNEEQRMDVIKNALEELPEQPYWTLDSFEQS